MNSRRESEIHWPGGALVALVRHPVTIGLVLAAITVLLFHPVRHHQFVNLDDPGYVTANPHVRGGLTIANALWALSGAFAGFWHPVTWWSHMLDVTCFGDSPVGPHLVNLGLHVLNVVLLFAILRRWTGAVWRSAFVAALFAWHPLRVESVAWVAERKDVLSGFFFLLTLWAYAEFARTQGAEKSRRPPWVYYTLALDFFVLGLMSKPMLVTVPFVLLLVDFWPLGRFPLRGHGSRVPAIRRLLREKIPFVVIAIAVCLVTVVTQKSRGAMQSLANCPPGVRLENALVSYARYLGKTLWPINLATPYADIRPWPVLVVIAAALLLVGLTFAAVRLGRRFPFVPMGWFWFCVMLLPVIGIVQVGAQSMADRFVYLPLIGVFILAVWSAGEAIIHWRLPFAVGAIVAGLVLLASAVRTRNQLGYWRDSETLLTHAIAVTQDNWIAHYNLAFELDRQGRLAEAEQHYREALAVQPFDFDTLNNLGLVLAREGKHALAIPLFETALRLRPDNLTLHYDLARSELQEKNFGEAIRQYQIFLQQQPDNLLALDDLGVAQGLSGDLPGAVASFREAARLYPNDANAHFNLGAALDLQSNSPAARREFEEALRLRPHWADAEFRLQALDQPANQPVPTGRNP